MQSAENESESNESQCLETTIDDRLVLLLLFYEPPLPNHKSSTANDLLTSGIWTWGITQAISDITGLKSQFLLPNNCALGFLKIFPSSVSLDFNGTQNHEKG
jgi:hypothetical protein